MPLYEYHCECGNKFERISTKDNKTAICMCGQKAARIISNTAPPQFKGQGFHATDYKGK